MCFIFVVFIESGVDKKLDKRIYFTYFCEFELLTSAIMTSTTLTEDITEIIGKLDVSNITPADEEGNIPDSSDKSSASSGGDNSARGAMDNDNVSHNSSDSAERLSQNGHTTQNGKEDRKKKRSGPLNFLRKKSKESSDNVPNKEKTRRTSAIPMELKVDSLPQIFITKYLGSALCEGLWGIQHTHPPVTKLVAKVTKLKKGEDLPLTQLCISNKGTQIFSLYLF